MSDSPSRVSGYSSAIWAFEYQFKYLTMFTSSLDAHLGAKCYAENRKTRVMWAPDTRRSANAEGGDTSRLTRPTTFCARIAKKILSKSHISLNSKITKRHLSVGFAIKYQYLTTLSVVMNSLPIIRDS